MCSTRRRSSTLSVTDRWLTGLNWMFRTTNPAHAFGAKGTPGCMRLHEIMGIMQSRQWGVCSLNDFRRVRIYPGLDLMVY